MKRGLKIKWLVYGIALGLFLWAVICFWPEMNTPFINIGFLQGQLPQGEFAMPAGLILGIFFGVLFSRSKSLFFLSLKILAAVITIEIVVALGYFISGEIAILLNMPPAYIHTHLVVWGMSVFGAIATFLFRRLLLASRPCCL